MHERSLVKSLLQQVNRVTKENDGAEVVEVIVEIGPLSGVEMNLVRIAFDELCGVVDLVKDPEGDGSLARSTTAGARLHIVEVPLSVRCTRCDIVSELTDFVFRCGRCGSGKVTVVGGDEFRLISLTLAEGAIHGY